MRVVVPFAMTKRRCDRSPPSSPFPCPPSSSSPSPKISRAASEDAALADVASFHQPVAWDVAVWAHDALSTIVRRADACSKTAGSLDHGLAREERSRRLAHTPRRRPSLYTKHHGLPPARRLRLGRA